jgi:hypothetical protein
MADGATYLSRTPVRHCGVGMSCSFVSQYHVTWDDASEGRICVLLGKTEILCTCPSHTCTYNLTLLLPKVLLATERSVQDSFRREDVSGIKHTSEPSHVRPRVIGNPAGCSVFGLVRWKQRWFHEGVSGGISLRPRILPHLLMV